MKLSFSTSAVVSAVLASVFVAGCLHTRVLEPLPNAELFSESEVAYLQDLKSAIREKLDGVKNWKTLDVRVNFVLSRYGRMSNIHIVSQSDITLEQKDEIEAAFQRVSPFRPFPVGAQRLKSMYERFSIDIKTLR